MRADERERRGNSFALKKMTSHKTNARERGRINDEGEGGGGGVEEGCEEEPRKGISQQWENH